MKIAPTRWWDWTAVLCFLAALITVSYRLSDTKWTENLNLVTSLTLIGAVTGLLLGVSRFQRWVATLIGLGYSIVVLPWQLTKIIPGEVAFAEKLASLGGRLWTSFDQFLRNQPLTDSALFLANMALLFWLAALVGGYSLTRHGKPWLSMVIGGIAIIIIDIYHPAVGNRGIAMALYIILMLVLVTQLHFLHRKREWDGDDVSVDTDTGFSWSRGALITAFVLVLLAWNVNAVVKAVNSNTPEHHRGITLWNDIRLRFENAVRPLRGTTVVPREYFGDQFSLGQGSQLSDSQVFAVDPTITGRIGVPYYWRVRSYDRYENGRWSTSINNEAPLATNTAVASTERYTSRINIGFKFRPERNLSMLYAPSIPLTISRPVTLVYDEAIGKLVDVTVVSVDPMVRAGETYEVVSMIAAPTVAQLREAGVEYPEWVTNKYLQLPVELPASISNLALEITSGIENPYDKVVAVTNWLRENIEYSQILPQVPQGADSIEWMLFEQKQAFCNYYATAEILMLRSLGIPARWVVGYAQGEYDPNARVYIVRERDSHAWPEVFFPEYGWVEFEPTASQAIINRPSGAGSNTTGGQQPGASAQIDEGDTALDRTVEDDPNAERFGSRSGFASIGLATLRVIAAIGAVLFIPLFAWLMVLRGRRNPSHALPVMIEKTLRKRGMKVPAWLGLWSRFTHLSPIERIFIQVSWQLKLLRNPAKVGSTPQEQIMQLVDTLPSGALPARTVLEEYQKATYSPYPSNYQAAQDAAKALWKLTIMNRLSTAGDWITGSHRSIENARFIRSR